MQRAIVERARSGDREAFSELARTSITRLYAVATLILRDSDRAQDVVQEALVLAWQDIHALRDADAWDAWLHRLTVRACYKAAHKERRRNLNEVQVDIDPEFVGAVDISISVAERDRLEREMGRLPIELRAVMVVHYYLDLPISRAAEVLDIPVGTVKSRLHHGLATLRRSMRDEPEATQVLAPGRPA